jgi:hypothetical protein
MVRSYLTAFQLGVMNPFQRNAPTAGFQLTTDVFMELGSKHGRWCGRWLHGKPTRAMIYKIFVLLAGVLLGLGYVCNDQYYRPITGILVGTVGLMMFAFWGISEEDVR